MTVEKSDRKAGVPQPPVALPTARVDESRKSARICDVSFWSRARAERAGRGWLFADVAFKVI
jgi:hypothetical protein